MPPKREDECSQAREAFREGNAAKQAADHAGALAQYTKGLETARSIELQSALRVNRGVTLVMLGRHAEALADSEQCAKIRPSWSKTYELQASALLALGRTQEADAASRLATALALLKQDPKNSAQKSLVKSIREEIRSLQAEPPCDGDGGAAAPVSSDVSQPPQDEPSRVGALDESSTATPTGAELSTEVASTHSIPPLQSDASQEHAATENILRGNELHQAGDFEGALSYYSLALGSTAESKEKSAIFFNCSLANCHLKRFDLALSHAQNCIEANPGWVRGYEAHGVALEGLGKFSEALEAFELALKIDPTNEPLQTSMQVLRRKLQDEEQTESGKGIDSGTVDVGVAAPEENNENTGHVETDAWWKKWQARSGMLSPTSPRSPEGGTDADELSEAERQRVREVVKARRRDSSLNQSVRGESGNVASTPQTSPAPPPRSSVSLQAAPAGGHSWEAEAIKMQTAAAAIRAREEALGLRPALPAEPLLNDTAAHEAYDSIPQSRGEEEVQLEGDEEDPVVQTLTQKLQEIRDNSARIQELDAAVRASAYKTGEDLKDAISEVKDEIVALEQLSAAQASEHRRQFTKLLDTLNKSDAQEKAVLDAQRRALGTGGDDEHHVIQGAEQKAAEECRLREKEALLQANEEGTHKVLALNREISRLEHEAMLLRTQYLDREKSGRARLETLHLAIREQDANIETLDAELRKAYSSLDFAKNLVHRTSAVSLQTENESKTQELQEQMRYMQAIKSIQSMKKKIAEEDARLQALNEKIGVLDQALNTASENSSLMAMRFDNEDHLHANVSLAHERRLNASLDTSAAPPARGAISFDSSVVDGRSGNAALLHSSPADAAWVTRPPSWGVNDVKVPLIPAVAGTSSYQKPNFGKQLNSHLLTQLSPRSQADGQRWPSLLSDQMEQRPSADNPEPSDTSAQHGADVWF